MLQRIHRNFDKHHKIMKQETQYTMIFHFNPSMIHCASLWIVVHPTPHDGRPWLTMVRVYIHHRNRLAIRITQIWQVLEAPNENYYYVSGSINFHDIPAVHNHSVTNDTMDAMCDVEGDEVITFNHFFSNLSLPVLFLFEIINWSTWLSTTTYIS